MKHLLEWDDPELDGLLGDLRNLSLEEDRVRIRFYVSTGLLATISFPQENKNRGAVEDSTTIRYLNNDDFIIEDGPSWPQNLLKSKIILRPIIGDSLYYISSNGKNKVEKFIWTVSKIIIRKNWVSSIIDEKGVRGEYLIDGKVIYEKEAGTE